MALARLDLWKEEDVQDLASVVLMRLLLKMVVNGYLPVDEDGDIVYMFDPYGFSVIFGSAGHGGEERLKKVIHKAIHEVDTYVQAKMAPIFVEGSDAEYFDMQFTLNDYRTESERNRLALALYLRVVILASAQGFVAVPPVEEDEKHE